MFMVYSLSDLLSLLDKGYQLWDVMLKPLQLYAKEGWRTICYDGINIDVAHVVCRQNGFINATTIEKSDL